METASTEIAFVTLTAEEISHIEPLGTRHVLEDGTIVFQAGDRDIDLYIVEAGALEILNPTDDNRCVARHEKGQFAGDIDLLTRRPVVVTAVARGETHVLRIPGAKVREVLLRVPMIGEKLLRAFQDRRTLLARSGKLGLTLTGPAECKDTNLIREFLDKNFVPYVWVKQSPTEACTLDNGHASGGPVVDCGGGKVLRAPTLQEIAHCTGVWQECPIETVDLAIVGAGPAGMSAAVYAASEGLSTLVLDGLGPGGQAAASSKIENFIGFPAGLSGTELATRAVIQMLKFGAQLVAPVRVLELEKAGHPGGEHLLHMDCGSIVRARNVLIATGLAWRHLAALGSARFEDIGIFYACTTTQTIMHQGEQVAVVGAGNSAGQAAMFLAEQCAHTVHMLIRGSDLGASMSRYLVERINATSNIEVHTNVEITDIVADHTLRGVDLMNTDGEPSHLDVSALYVFIGAEPQISWLPPEAARDSKGYLLTGAEAAASGEWPLSERPPCLLETSIPNVFAAGDIRTNSPKRVGFAVGDGALAVACIHSLR